jgi:hypothetical protein
MAEISTNESGTPQWLALLFLAGWIVLVAVLGFFMLTGRATAASATVEAARPDVSTSAVLHSKSGVSARTAHQRRSYDDVSL